MSAKPVTMEFSAICCHTGVYFAQHSMILLLKVEVVPFGFYYYAATD